MPQSLTLFDIVPGKVIADRYTVVGANRQGGFSTVFEVTDGEDGSRCEMQLFPAGLFEESQADEFRHKLEPWQSIGTEYVLSVRGVFQVDADNLALITAFPEGRTLRKRLNDEKSLSRGEVVAIGTRLLSGLSEVHGKGLVHGDIKPLSIYLKAEGKATHPQLIDGGVTPSLWTAKDLGDKTALIGTPYYAPIEQFGGDAPDVRSDIYNVATVLFECITGVLPWAGRSFLEVFQAKLSDPPPMSERAPDVQVDEELESVIRRGCLADRNKRYASAAEFREALEALAG